MNRKTPLYKAVAKIVEDSTTGASVRTREKLISAMLRNLAEDPFPSYRSPGGRVSDRDRAARHLVDAAITTLDG